MMRHRKIEHPESVKQCKDDEANICEMGHKRCWYMHVNNVEVFQVGPDSQEPPEKTINNKSTNCKQKKCKRGKRKSVNIVENSLIVGGVNPDGAMSKISTIKKDHKRNRI